MVWAGRDVIWFEIRLSKERKVGLRNSVIYRQSSIRM
jgi:hypothetical protein